jgi:hypothetical protein
VAQGSSASVCVCARVCVCVCGGGGGGVSRSLHHLAERCSPPSSCGAIPTNERTCSCEGIFGNFDIWRERTCCAPASWISTGTCHHQHLRVATALIESSQHTLPLGTITRHSIATLVSPNKLQD